MAHSGYYTATSSVENVNQLVQEAAGYAQQASDYATQAESSAADANSSVTEAQGYADSALASANLSAASEGLASTAANNAEGFAASASGSETNAAASASFAYDQSQLALASEVAAAASEAAAAQSAQDAQDAVTTSVRTFNNLSDLDDAPTSIQNLGAVGVSYGRKNLLINGDFGVWQRGTSFGPTTSTFYGPDRWRILAGAGNTIAAARSLPTTQPMVSQSLYTLNLYRTVNGGGVTSLRQRIESSRTAEGATVTLSMYLWNSSGSTKNLLIDTVFGDSAGSSKGVVSVGQIDAPSNSDWTKYTLTFEMPSSSSYGVNLDGTDFVELSIKLDGSQGTWASGELRFHAIQLEVGPVATAFEALTLNQQFLDCARYYYEPVNPAGSGARLYVASATATMFNRSHPYPTQMRATPTSAISGVTYSNCSNIVVSANRDAAFTRVDVSAAGVYQATGYSLTLDAEL